jgi:hypothetical protein
VIPSQFLSNIIDPACRDLEAIFDIPASVEARVLMLAIALQETGLNSRLQKSTSGYLPHLARGFWQFEKNGGVAGVLSCESTKEAAQYLCSDLVIPYELGIIHDAIAYNDRLSASFARLLLWTDPTALPEIGDEQGAWDCYIRNWRPGKPHREAWTKHYATALACVRPSPALETQPVATESQTTVPVTTATATIVVPQVQPETKDDRFVTAPGKASSEWYVTLGYLAAEFAFQAFQVYQAEPVDLTNGWIPVAVYVAGRTLVKMSAAIGKSPTVVVAKK